MGELHRLTPRGAPDDGSSDLSCHRAKTKDSIARPWPFLTSVTVSASGQRDPVTLQSTCPAWRRLVHLGRYPAKTCLPIPRCRDVSGRGSDLPEVVEVAGRALELRSHLGRDRATALLPRGSDRATVRPWPRSAAWAVREARWGFRRGPSGTGSGRPRVQIPVGPGSGVFWKLPGPSCCSRRPTCLAPCVLASVCHHYTSAQGVSSGVSGSAPP